ncbi:MAG TPA: hypothetical protein ENK99_00540 [Campylobacterales bacterium]|nr:hypothetical protein [Campylobacterales bacterium]
MLIKNIFLSFAQMFTKVSVAFAIFYSFYYIATEYERNAGTIFIIFFTLFAFAVFFMRLYRVNALNSKVKNALKGLKEFNEAEKIRLFSVTDIGQKYKPLEMIEVLEHSKENARHALQFKAKELGADAVVNVVASITSDTKGKINADTLFTHGGGGSIETSNMYYYTGTAVKFV